MNLSEFKSSHMTTGRVQHKDFSADIAYSAAGSGHYFTLRAVRYDRISSFKEFLKEWERDYTFCVKCDIAETRTMLADRGYSIDEHNDLRIGMVQESMAERAERRARDKKTLPRHGRQKAFVTPNVKARIANQIETRETNGKQVDVVQANGKQVDGKKKSRWKSPPPPIEKRIKIKAAGDKKTRRPRRTKAEIIRDAHNAKLAKLKDAVE